MSFRLALLLGVGLLAAFPVGAMAQTTPYYVTDIGSLGSGSSYGLGINNNGQVVGVSYMTTDPNSEYRAFLYDHGTTTDLFGQYSYSVAYGINNSGQIAGSLWSVPTGQTSPQQYAYIYDPVAGTTIFNWGGSNCEALAINDSGNTVGYTYVSGDTTTQYFFTGNSASGTAYTFGGYLTGSSASANAINSSNLVAGSYNTTAGAPLRAFVFDGTNGYDLGTLGGSSAVANAINAVDGTGNFKVAGDSTITGDAATHAFLFDWTSGTMTDLGTLGGTNSHALGINASAQVVGDSDIAGDAATHAYIYSGGTMTDLNTLISPTSGWTLTVAAAINDSGSIVGTGINAAAQTHAFLLTPAMPGDANLDGTVNGVDLDAVLSNYNKTGMTWAQGDFNGDGVVNGVDLDIVLSNYNKTAGVPSMAAVPEPSTLAMLALGAIAMLAWAGRGRRSS